VTKILVSEGDTVPIGGAILEVDADGAPAAEAAAETPAPAPAPEPTPEPTPTPSPVAEAPAPAAPATPTPAPATPTPAATPVAPSAPAAPVATQPTVPGRVIPAGPAIRRFAREVGVDLSQVAGSGDNGRITREDVLAVVRSASQSARASVPSAPAASASAPKTDGDAKPLPGTADVDDFGPIRVERMSKIRKTIAKQMHASWSNVPRVTNFDDADITDLEHLRQSSKEDYAAQGLKLTTMPFLIKAVATALRHHPAINAIIDEENEQLIYKDYVNVGIAVDTDRGLVVPVMDSADSMGIPEVTRALAEMAGKVRGGNFSVNDLRGGTFTISNLGAIGGQYSTPIVNIPEVAILLVGRSRKLPVVMPDDSIQSRLMMPLSLSYDHRMVDGATAARFLNDVIGYLEAPSRLLLAL
ncbi:MAG: 2-oxo acid dehydrogenase subunit E2, partial [Rubripirellula sp.]